MATRRRDRASRLVIRRGVVQSRCTASGPTSRLCSRQHVGSCNPVARHSVLGPKSQHLGLARARISAHGEAEATPATSQTPPGSNSGHDVGVDVIAALHHLVAALLRCRPRVVPGEPHHSHRHPHGERRLPRGQRARRRGEHRGSDPPLVGARWRLHLGGSGPGHPQPGERRGSSARDARAQERLSWAT